MPAPQEEDMPEAPADAEERPASPADADAAPPPQSAAEEDVLTPDAIPQPVCFVSQAAQPLDPPVPYMGDILLLQEGMCAGLFLTPTDHAHAGPIGGTAAACLTPHIHRWCPPPPPRGDRPVPRALHGRHGGVLVRCAGRRVRAGSRGPPHGVDANGPLHAAPELPRRRDVGPRPRGQGTPCHLLLRREGVPARCFACTRFCHTSHITRCIWRAPNTRLARQLRSWRAPISILACANSSVGARRVTSWRAKYPVGARQVQFWHAKSSFGAPSN